MQKVLEGKKSWREFIDPIIAEQKELVTLEKVANSSKNEDVIKEISATLNGIKTPSGRKF
jgi:predicted CopG family antitoxin